MPGLEPPFVTPVVVNNVGVQSPGFTRITVAGGLDSKTPVLPAKIFESDDGGGSFTEVLVPPDFGGVNTPTAPLVAGGRTPTSTPGMFTDNPDVLYAGSGNQVFLRDSPGGMLKATADIKDDDDIDAGEIHDIAIDPDDWKTAYAVDSRSKFYRTTDGGKKWEDLTGNLDKLIDSNGAFGLASLVVIPDVVVPGEGNAPRNLIVAGGEFGVYFLSAIPGENKDPVWIPLGDGLPNSAVFDLTNGTDKNGDTILVAGTFGRGTFSIHLQQALSSAKVAEIFHDDLEIEITGVTIVTHGYEPFDPEGDTMLPFARQLRQAIDDNNGNDRAWLLDFDTTTGLFDPTDSILPVIFDAAATGEIVINFDWSEDSQHVSAGWAESAGDALFALLTDLELIDPSTSSGPELHFIGQGMGAVVTSEAVERLAYYNVPVDHVTYLDPHDFDQGLVVDTAQRLDSTGQPTGYGAVVWDNVEFADVYYQTRGINGPDISDALVPLGRPIPGAFNFLVDATNYLPPDDYDSLNIFGDHRYVWEGFYLATITGEQPQDNALQPTADTPPPATPIPTGDLGYAFSRLVNPLSRPSATFYENPDRGAWQDDELYLQYDRVQHIGSEWVALRNHTSRDSGGGEPVNNQPGSPVSDNFWQLVDAPASDQDHTFSPNYIADAISGAPNFAGLLDHRLNDDLVTNSRQPSRWNPLEIVNGNFDDVGDLIGFNERSIPGWSNHLVTPDFDSKLLLDVPKKTVTLSEFSPGLTHNLMYIPAEAEFLAIDLQVTKVSGNDQFQVMLDNEVLVEETPVDLEVFDAEFRTRRFAIPEAFRNQTGNLTVRIYDGGDNDINAIVSIDNFRFEGYLFEVFAGDVTLIDLSSELVGTAFQILPPDILDAGRIIQPETLTPNPTGDDFLFSGEFFFVPDFDTDGNTITFDDDDGIFGNDAFATINFEVDLGDGLEQKVARIRVIDGYSKTGDAAIALTDSVGLNGVNNDIDVLRVQQRLRYLNFQGKHESIVEVDSISGSITEEAIRLFQAATQKDGRGNPVVNSDVVTGRVATNSSTERWLNSPLAPRWARVREALRNRVSVQDEGQDEPFGASWALQTIERAVAARPELMRIGSAEELGLHNLSEYPDNGPNQHPSPAHKAGVSIDWDLEQATLVEGTDPIDFSLPFQINQDALSLSERNVIRDIMAFVRAADAIGAGIEGGQRRRHECSTRIPTDS